MSPSTSSDPEHDAQLDDAFDRVVEDWLDRRSSPSESGAPEGESELADLVDLMERVRLRPGELLPHVPGYRIEGVLGRGGMGTVYLARRSGEAQPAVALKVAPFSPLLAPTSRTRFLREARSLSRVEHPNVVPILDTVDTPEVCAYAMELVYGTSLLEFLDAPAGAHAPLTPQRLARVGVQIAHALEAVHRCGLVHRDVKPQNVLLRRDGTALLADFGLVLDEQAATLTRDGTFLGTTAYASPEQLRGERASVDARSDLFSLGATLFHGLAGAAPFHGDSPLEQLASIEAGSLARSARWRATPADLRTIVRKALDPEPAGRYASAAGLAEDLERFLGARPIVARPPSATRRLGRALRRSRSQRRAALVGSACVATVLLGTWVVRDLGPDWARGQLQEARLTLLNPAVSEALYVAENREILGKEVSVSRTLEGHDMRARYEAAAVRYRRSSWFLENPLAQREVALLELALELWASARPGAPSGRPLVDDYVAAWSAADGAAREQRTLLAPEQMAKADWATRRDLGFLAFLLGDARTAADAWEELGSLEGEDPFVDGLHGILALMRNRPHLARAHLNAAARAFPDAAFLWIYLADAYLRSADLAQARRCLAHSGDARLEEPWSHREILLGELALLEGRFDEAEQHLEYVRVRHTSRRARLDLAWLYELAGELRLAEEMYWQTLGWADRTHYLPLVAAALEQMFPERAHGLEGEGTAGQEFAREWFGVWSIPEAWSALADRLRPLAVAWARSGRFADEQVFPGIRERRSSIPLSRLPRTAPPGRLWENQSDLIKQRSLEPMHSTLTKSLAVLATFAALVGSSLAAPQLVEFRDSTFLNSDWEQEIIYSTHGGSSSASKGPGACDATNRVVTNSLVAISGDISQVWTFERRLGAVYDPAVHGAIEYVEGSMDVAILAITCHGTGQGFYVALEQDGQVYVCTSQGMFDPDCRTFTFSSLMAQDFRVVGGTGGQYPDFSSSGAPITFGFGTFDSHSSGGGPSCSITAGYDDWYVGVAPCTGSLGTSYCVGSPNSVGPGARIAASGCGGVFGNDLTLTVTALPPNKPGLFYFGSDTIDLPFGNGHRCVGGEVHRLYPVLVSNGAGEVQLSVDLEAPPAAGNIVAGSSWSFQYWYRDPLGGGAGFNLSDAVRIDFW